MKLIMLFLQIVIFNFSNQAIAKGKIEDIDMVLVQENLTVGFHAPNGFFLDKESGQNFGLCGFYAKTGQTFHTSPVIIYAQVANSAMSGDKGIEQLIKDVSQSYSSRSKTFKTEKKSSYASKNKMSFEVRYFLNGPPPNNFEAGAYLKLNSRIVQIIYSAKSEKDFENNIKSFYDSLDRIEPYSSKIPALAGRCLYPAPNNTDKN